MSNLMFSYDQQMASQIGGGLSYKSGGYDVKIVSAKFVNGKSLELNLEEKEGRKFNYVSINYQKNDGQPNDYGWKMINAIMGSIGVVKLSSDNNGNCPELIGRYLKAVLQRIDYTKTSGEKAGEDAWKFDFKLPANIKTGQTVKEALEGKPAEVFDKLAMVIEDKDERVSGSVTAGNNQSSSQHNQAPQYNEPSIDFDDDIPFGYIGITNRKLLNCM